MNELAASVLPPSYLPSSNSHLYTFPSLYQSLPSTLNPGEGDNLLEVSLRGEQNDDIT